MGSSGGHHIGRRHSSYGEIVFLKTNPKAEKTWAKVSYNHLYSGWCGCLPLLLAGRWNKLKRFINPGSNFWVDHP